MILYYLQAKYNYTVGRDFVRLPEMETYSLENFFLNGNLLVLESKVLSDADHFFHRQVDGRKIHGLVSIFVREVHNP